MLKSKKNLVLAIFIILISIPGFYAENMPTGELSFTPGIQNLDRADSYIQPSITVNKPGYYSWTVVGPVFFSHGKSGGYWDSGALVLGVSTYWCHISKSLDKRRRYSLSLGAFNKGWDS